MRHIACARFISRSDPHFRPCPRKVKLFAQNKERFREIMGYLGNPESPTLCDQFCLIQCVTDWYDLKPFLSLQSIR